MRKLKGKRLRIYMSETDKIEHTPLYEWILKQADEAKMIGATAVRGIEGFGSKHHMHSNKILRLSQNLPIILEINDMPSKIESFLKTIESDIGDACLTLEDIEIIAADEEMEE